MSVDEGLFASICEALEPLGNVTKRAMMGGATLYLDGTVFAIMDEGELYLKADDETNGVWDEAGCARFTVEMAGKPATMNYRRAPDEVYEDAEAMQRWARLALEAGVRAAAKRTPKAANKAQKARRSGD